jgi:penicillin-binding protein-related factor A (putative recombinase)
MSLKNAVTGLKSKRQGETFETVIKIAASKQKISYLKIPTGCEMKRTAYGLKTFMVKSPFDFIMAFNKKVLFFDVKSTKSDHFVRSSIDMDQVDSMHKLHEQGLPTGLIIFFNADNRLTASGHFFSLNKILELKKGESLRPNSESLIGQLYPSLNLDLISLFNKL